VAPPKALASGDRQAGYELKNMYVS